MGMLSLRGRLRAAHWQLSMLSFYTTVLIALFGLHAFTWQAIGLLI